MGSKQSFKSGFCVLKEVNVLMCPLSSLKGRSSVHLREGQPHQHKRHAQQQRRQRVPEDLPHWTRGESVCELVVK